MSELPILKYKDEIKRALKESKLIIIKGETGCGKTTQVPQIINELYFCNKKNETTKKKNNKKKKERKMIISLPRKVATITVAERVAKEMNQKKVGDYVGYTIRFKNVCSKNTRIKFATDGILIREIMNSPLLKKYKFLILDEIHERSIRTDVLLGYAKILLQKRKNLKIILMSATFDTTIFNQYFNNPPIISIPHKIHKVSIFYPKKTVEDYLLSIVCTILQIHLGNSYIKNEENAYYFSCENGDNHESDVQSDEEEQQEEKERERDIHSHSHSKLALFSSKIKQGFSKKEKKNSIGDILVFLPGQEEIELVNMMLKEKLKIIYKGSLLSKLINDKNQSKDGSILNKINNKINPDNQIISDISFHFGKTEIIPDKIYAMKILQLYSSLPNKKQRIIFDPVSDNTRKVILSTNIAETSVTIPNIKYVIDSGKVKIRFFDIQKGSNVLKITQISKDSAIQRTGRAGRESSGKVFRMYTKEEYENMSPFLIPEIFRTDLTQIYLELKAMNIINPLNFEFPENPKKEFFLHSAKMLYKINAIDVNNNLTDLGKKLCLFPLNPIYANILLLSIEFNCVDEVATIVAILNCDSIFLNYNFYDDLNSTNEQTLQSSNKHHEVNKNDTNEKKRKIRTDEEEEDESDGGENEAEAENFAESKINDKSKLINIARRKLIHPDGDHLTLLHIFYLWKEASSKEKEHFCNVYALNNEILLQVEKIKIQLLEIIKNKMKIDISKKITYA